MVKVTNRSNGFVVYSVPEMNNLRREYAPNETKEISREEIERVCYQQGGRELFYNFLFIDDESIIKEVLNVTPEQEYWLKPNEISSWMVNCSLDEFKDALDFAPEGIKELIKAQAVTMPLNDSSKRDAIYEILHFNVNSAIENTKQDADAEQTQTAQRRVNKETGATRRVSLDQLRK